jgi:hypothetical protein
MSNEATVNRHKVPRLSSGVRRNGEVLREVLRESGSHASGFTDSRAALRVAA